MFLALPCFSQLQLPTLSSGLGWAGLAEPGRQEEGGVGMHWLRTCPDSVSVPCWETELQLHVGWLYRLVPSTVPICHKHNVPHSALAARVGVMGLWPWASSTGRTEFYGTWGKAGLKMTHSSRQASPLQLCCLFRALGLENPQSSHLPSAAFPAPRVGNRKSWDLNPSFDLSLH